MEIRQLNEITINLDNKRKPLNNVQRDMMKTNPKYPYYGANGIVDFIDDYIFDQEILCVAEDGGSWGKNEKCSYIVYDKCWVNNHAHVLVATSSIDIKYLSYYLNQCDLNKYITGTTRGKLTKKALDSILIPLPPLQTQKKIVEILDKAQEIIDGRKEQIKLMDELIQSTFYEMFGDPVTNTKGWEKKPLSEVIRIGGGYAFKSKEYKTEGVPIIKIGTVNKGYFDSSNFDFWNYNKDSKLDNYIIYPGDLLISLTGTVGKEDYGNVCFADNSFEKYLLNQRVGKLELIDEMSKIFIKMCFENNKFKSQIIKVSRGVRQANISNRDIYGLDIITPPIHLQNQFAEKVEAIEKQKELMEKSLTEMENSYNGLMQKAFKGELF